MKKFAFDEFSETLKLAACSLKSIHPDSKTYQACCVSFSAGEEANGYGVK